jgi:hypothetical protein
LVVLIGYLSGVNIIIFICKKYHDKIKTITSSKVNLVNDNILISWNVNREKLNTSAKSFSVGRGTQLRGLPASA